MMIVCKTVERYLSHNLLSLKIATIENASESKVTFGFELTMN
jgi:hypothetical protein